MPQAQGVGLKRLTELHNYHALVSVETKINHMPEPKYMKPIHSRHVSYQTNYTAIPLNICIWRNFWFYHPKGQK